MFSFLTASNFAVIFDREQSSKVLKEALLLLLLFLLLGGIILKGTKNVRNGKKMFLEQNHGIEMPCVALYSLVQ